MSMKIKNNTEYEKVNEEDFLKVKYLFFPKISDNKNNKIYEMKNLTEVFIREQQINEKFINLNKIIDLGLVSCKIDKTVLNNLNQFENLTKLFLINCNIKEIPNAIYELTKLSELTLNDNDIQYISPKIKNLVNLTGLYLADNNKIKNLPEEINYLYNLTDLILPSYCYDFNIGGLIKLNSFVIISEYPYGCTEDFYLNKKIKVHKNYIYEDKIVVMLTMTNIPENIKYVNFINQPDNLNNISFDVEYIKIPKYDNSFNFPITLKELRITESIDKYKVKAPYNCKIYINEKLIEL